MTIENDKQRRDDRRDNGFSFDHLRKCLNSKWHGRTAATVNSWICYSLRAAPESATPRFGHTLNTLARCVLPRKRQLPFTNA